MINLFNTRRKTNFVSYFILLCLLVLLVLLSTNKGFLAVAQTNKDTIERFNGVNLIGTKTADTNDGNCNADCSLREAVAEAGFKRCR